MKYGFVLPHGDARWAADCARLAEQSGWDGFFVYETVWGTDAWVSLTAAAMLTQHIRLGTLITPLSRMRPWRLASQTATLDHLSGGRVILSVGLGAVETGFADFGEVTDRKLRAQLLDEGLDILTGLWKGQPFSYEGRHYRVRPCQFPHRPPSPVQQPRIPIWVAAAWKPEQPDNPSMARALRHDGILINVFDPQGKSRPLQPSDMAQVRAFSGDAPTLVAEGCTPGDSPGQAAETLSPWIEAGADWWIEADWTAPDSAEGRESIWRRLSQGPPPG